MFLTLHHLSMVVNDEITNIYKEIKAIMCHHISHFG